MRGLSRPPSGHLPSVDALDAGRADARRLLRPPPLAASHHHGVLTPPLAAATAARGTATPHAASTRDWSGLRPWLAYGAATAWPSPCHWSARAVAAPAVSWHAAGRNYHKPGTRRAAAARRPRPCIVC